MSTIPLRHVPGLAKVGDLEQLPRSGTLLGCRRCGLPVAEHGRSVIHRFVRPDLPPGYRYLDETGVGDELALRRRPPEQSIVVAQLGAA